MKKRYQIFISSTFSDLVNERKSVMEAILSLDCFPAGMEMFPASDDEQFEYIKTIIDESDYYVLIIAGRYGSIADDGKSYTQKEYEYAKEKGIPILTFIKKDIENTPLKDTDQDAKKKKNLMNFIKIATANKMVAFWENDKDLQYVVNNSLNKAFKTHPRIGWARGNIDNNEKLLQELNSMRRTNEDLNKQLNSLKQSYEALEKQNGSIFKEHMKKLNEDLSLKGIDEDNSSQTFVIPYRKVFESVALSMYESEMINIDEIGRCLDNLINAQLTCFTDV